MGFAERSTKNAVDDVEPGAGGGGDVLDGILLWSGVVAAIDYLDRAGRRGW